MEFKSLYFNLVYVFLFSSKTRIYINKTHLHKAFGAENSTSILFDVSPFYFEDMKNYLLSLSVSRAVSQVIMRIHKPTLEYKLALQQKPQGSTLKY